MNDRIYSLLLDFILENFNFKSGIILGSYSFELVLLIVVDFKVFVFEFGGFM